MERNTQGRRNWGEQEGQPPPLPFFREIAIVRNVSAILLRICFRKRKKCSHRASRIAQLPGVETPHTPIIQ